jgi:predicted molibdopterin-dependent oxidoreductase YjgC
VPRGVTGATDRAGPDLRVRVDLGVHRGAPIQLTFDGQQMAAFEGETVAAALTAAGVRVLRTTAGGEARGVFCGMGTCYDCLMVIDGQPSRRACMEPVRDGMEVRTQTDAGDGP